MTPETRSALVDAGYQYGPDMQDGFTRLTKTVEGITYEASALSTESANYNRVLELSARDNSAYKKVAFQMYEVGEYKRKDLSLIVDHVRDAEKALLTALNR